MAQKRITNAELKRQLETVTQENEKLRVSNARNKKLASRKFEGAKQFNELQNWIQDNLKSFREEIKSDRAALVGRSRDASINDAYARRYFQSLAVNVIGQKGIELKNQARNTNGSLDKVANDVIDAAWKKWSRAVTVDGMSMRKAQKLILKTVARDGEVFIYKRRGKGFGPFQFQLQVIDLDYIASSYSAILKNGNVVQDGIEYDSIGRPIAYHIYKNNPSTYNTPPTHYNSEILRIDASDIIHLYDRERAEQGRGFPWLSAALISLKHLSEYRKSELVASRIASLKPMFYTRTANGELMNDLGDDNYADDETYALQTDLEPGQAEILPEGYDVKLLDPTHPNGNFKDFVKVILRAVSASLGVCYHTLSGDLESTSYSSLRQGAIDERETYKDIQEWLIEDFLTPLYEEWLKNLLNKRLAGVRLPVEFYDKFNAPEFRPRKWAWIDPGKEAAAIKMQLDYNLRSKAEIVKDLGREWVDVIEEIAQERTKMDELNVYDKNDPLANLMDEGDDEPTKKKSEA